jgi:hypothetical protein
MLPDIIPHLSLGTTALVVFAICVAWILLRGIGRMLRGAAFFAASCWAGLTIFHFTPELCHSLFGKSHSVLLIALPLLAFFATFWVLHQGCTLLLLPFRALQTEPRTRPSLITGLLFAIFPAAILFFLSASVLHHFGAIEEIRAFSAVPNAERPDRLRVFVRDCKSSLDHILPEEILRYLDPATDPTRVMTAKLVTRRSQQTHEPIIDPSTGKPYPRAIIVDDPELQMLAREGKFGTLLRHPVLTKASKDPVVQKILSHFRFP